jgi:methionine-rich copper-binding protein CopC
LFRRLNSLTIALAIVLAPTLIFAASAHQFKAGKAVSPEANVVTVPLEITNADNLAAIDIPLQFSEGVTLKEVTFTDTRVEYFDLKIANINNEQNTVVIGLLPQMTPQPKPDLAAGTGPVANLVFAVDDPSVTEVTLEAVEMRNPGHFLAFVYHDFDENGVPHSRVERPEFDAVTVALSGAPSAANLPTSFALHQNYPNPFNPVTTVAFDLPQASKVKLTVFNILGQEVETLIDREMEAGQHSVEWAPTGFSSGIYFYRLETDSFTDTRKMAFIK